MLISTFTLTKISDTLIKVAWTATDLTKRCWLYRNGVLINKFYDTSSASREEMVSIEPDSLSIIEIHECTRDDPTTLVDEEEPVVSFTEIIGPYEIKWDRVSDASYYAVYHQEADNSEVLIHKYYQEDATQKYSWSAPVLEDIGGIWHHFRVESVDAWNNTSTRELWHYFVYGMPGNASAVSVAGAGWVFDITVTI